MKNMKYILMALLMAFVFYGRAIAADGDVYNDGFWNITSSGNLAPMGNLTYDIGTSTKYVDDLYVDNIYARSDVVLSSGQVKIVPLPLDRFTLVDSTTIAPITASTAPGLEVDNYITSLVWADDEVSKATVTFNVPDDYYSGGAFRLFLDESASTTPVQVDFYVYVNKGGQVWDTSATDQTPVAMTEDAGTPEVVTLSVATDFSSLAAGDKVSLFIWRDNTTQPTADGDMELYYAEFYYTAKR